MTRFIILGSIVTFYATLGTVLIVRGLYHIFLSETLAQMSEVVASLCAPFFLAALPATFSSPTFSVASVCEQKEVAPVAQLSRKRRNRKGKGTGREGTRRMCARKLRFA
jgi:hypothetical protein